MLGLLIAVPVMVPCKVFGPVVLLALTPGVVPLPVVVVWALAPAVFFACQGAAVATFPEPAVAIGPLKS